MDRLAGPLLCDPGRKAELEARNGDDQLDYITDLVERGARELRESHVLTLQEIAIREIYPCGGRYRNATKDVFIQNSKHLLPDVAFVPSLVRDAVDWINRETSRSALERASYALWRFNWIHPFAGGNGRTSRRAASTTLHAHAPTQGRHGWNGDRAPRRRSRATSQLSRPESGAAWRHCPPHLGPCTRPRRLGEAELTTSRTKRSPDQTFARVGATRLKLASEVVVRASR